MPNTKSPTEDTKSSTYVKTAILMLALLLLYSADIRSMAAMWAEFNEYSHGYLIPFISGYLIWRKRDAIQKISMKPDAGGLILLLISLLLYILGHVAYENFVIRVSFVTAVIGIFFMMMGREAVKLLLFPIGYLLFMVPPPYGLMKSFAVNLKLFSAKATFLIVKLTGIPILQEGARLELPNITLIVADFCTGILSILAVTAIAVLYAYLTQKTILKKTLLVLLAVPCAIAGNLGRLVLSVVIAYYIGERALDTLVHQFQGTVNFLVTIFFLFLIGRFLNRLDSRVPDRGRG